MVLNEAGSEGPYPTAADQQRPRSPNSANSPEDTIETQQEKQTRILTGFKWFLFNICTLSGHFLYALDNTVVANIQPVIVNEFNAVDKLPWLSVGFMIGGLCMVMPLGKLYALYDGKWLFFSFAVNFMAASALCGGAPTMPAMIIGRVWAGAGGNGMYYGILNLFSMHTLERERPTYMGITGMVWGLGTILGPVVGGSFELVSWRWAFYINLFFAIFLLPSYIFVIPASQPAPHLSLKEKIKSFDWTGAILSAGTLVTFIVATNFGGVLFDWNSGAIIALYVVSGLLFLMFAIQQTFAFLTTEEYRMFPVHLVRRKEVVLLFVIIACGGTIAYVSVYYFPIYYQFTRGDTAVQTSYRMLPLIFGLIVGQLMNGFLMSKLGYYKPWYIFGAALAVAGGVLMSQAQVSTSNSAIYGYQWLLGFGSGCFVTAGFSVVQANVDPKDSVHGVTLMTLGQLSGLAFSLSMTGAIFVNLALRNLKAVFPDVDEATLVSVVSGTSGHFLETLSEQERGIALDAIVSAMQKPFVQVSSAAAVAFVLSWMLKWKKAYGVAAGGA